MSTFNLLLIWIQLEYCITGWLNWWCRTWSHRCVIFVHCTDRLAVKNIIGSFSKEQVLNFTFTRKYCTMYAERCFFQLLVMAAIPDCKTNISFVLQLTHFSFNCSFYFFSMLFAMANLTKIFFCSNIKIWLHHDCTFIVTLVCN